MTSPEEAVRVFFAAYSDGAPERFVDCVSEDYRDFGHDPPGRGPQGARDDYEHAVETVGGIPTTIGAPPVAGEGGPGKDGQAS